MFVKTLQLTLHLHYGKHPEGKNAMVKREEKLEEAVPGVDKENGQGGMPWSEGWAGTLAMPRFLGVLGRTFLSLWATISPPVPGGC